MATEEEEEEEKGISLDDRSRRINIDDVAVWMGEWGRGVGLENMDHSQHRVKVIATGMRV